jgi:hypothetical protein
MFQVVRKSSLVPFVCEVSGSGYSWGNRHEVGVPAPHNPEHLAGQVPRGKVRAQEITTVGF